MNGFKLRERLERPVRLAFFERPDPDQRADRTWTRQDLIESGDRLELEGYARKKAALAMVPNRTYSNEEVAFLVRKAGEV